MFRVPTLGLFWTCTENSFLFEHTYIFKWVHICLLIKKWTHLLGKEIPFSWRQISTQVPCSKQTALGPLRFLSPLVLASRIKFLHTKTTLTSPILLLGTSMVQAPLAWSRAQLEWSRAQAAWSREQSTFTRNYCCCYCNQTRFNSPPPPPSPFVPWRNIFSYTLRNLSYFWNSEVGFQVTTVKHKCWTISYSQLLQSILLWQLGLGRGGGVEFIYILDTQ
jgi:hypothetical protein